MLFFSGKCRTQARLDYKVVIITGANSGIGKETAVELVRRGAVVVMANRNLKSTEEAMSEIRAKLSEEMLQLGFPPGTRHGELHSVHLDLSSLESVKKCGNTLLQKYPAIHILINNAGIMACDRAVTKDGIELQMGTNHIGHFLLTCMLLPRLIESKPSRIINLSSIAHRGGRIDFNDFNSENSYSPSFNYANTKLANIFFTNELARRLKENNITDVTVYAVHPGIVATAISRNLTNNVFIGLTFFWDYIMAPFIKNSEQGAQTTLHCALDEDAGKESGFYYCDCRKTTPARRALSKKNAQLLWEKSVELTKMTWDPFQGRSFGEFPQSPLPEVSSN